MIILFQKSCLGLSINDDKKLWQDFLDTIEEALMKVWEPLNNWVISKGASALKKNYLFKESPYMNIYNFPLELDYLDIRPLPPNWYRFDNFTRNSDDKNLKIPRQFLESNKKLIYFSLGSMGSINIQLMERMIGFLSKSEHNFIVSMAQSFEKIRLSNNMWGQAVVPQIQILSKVDLVITHGGNNTVAESLTFGKPMIVLPLFGDQYDTAQRVHDKGFGIRLDPFGCTRNELLDAINNLLNDLDLKNRLRNISDRIKNENSLDKLTKHISRLMGKER